MALPARFVCKLFHPFVGRHVLPSQVNWTVPCTGYSVTENDEIAAKWDVVLVDVSLTMVRPFFLTFHPRAALEAKFSKTSLLLIVRFVAFVHMLPPSCCWYASAQGQQQEI